MSPKCPQNQWKIKQNQWKSIENHENIWKNARVDIVPKVPFTDVFKIINENFGVKVSLKPKTSPGATICAERPMRHYVRKAPISFFEILKTAWFSGGLIYWHFELFSNYRCSQSEENIPVFDEDVSASVRAFREKLLRSLRNLIREGQPEPALWM